MQSDLRERDAGVGVVLTAAVLLAVVSVVGLGSLAAPATAATGTENVSMYTTERAGFEDASDIERAIADGSLDADDELVVGETLVIEVASERLAADVDGREGSATDGLFSALDEGAVLFLVQTNPTPMRPAKAVRLGPGNAIVHRSGTTTYVSVATGEVTPSWEPPQDDSTSEPELRGGERFAVRTGHENGSVTTGDAGVEFRLTEAELYGTYDPLAPELVNRSVAVHVAPDDEVTVRATLDDGTTLTVEPGPVDWSGFDGFTLDLRDVDPGTGYTIEVRHDGEVVDRRNGTVREPRATLEDPTVTTDDGDVYAARLNLTAALSHGGTVRVLDGDGTRVGVGRPAPGNRTDVSVGLRYGVEGTDEFDATELEVFAVREKPAGDVPYPGDDARLTLRVDEGWSATADDSTGTGTAAPGDAQGVDGSGDRTDDQGPGFGAVSLVTGVAALGYLLGVSLRRRDP